MEIRKDFASANTILEKFLNWGVVYEKNNIEHWPHLKNNEDFKLVYYMEDEVREKFDKLYGVGRDFSSSMAYQLIVFNDPRQYPTFTTYINSFESEWFWDIDRWQNTLKDAVDAKNRIENCPWAVEEMIDLFEEQLALRQHVITTLNLLKDTDIYRMENGEPVKNSGNIEVYAPNSAINVLSPGAHASVSVSRGIEKTLSQLIEIFQAAQFDSKLQNEQALEILESIRSELQNPKPKKFSIRAMISTLSSLASLATIIHENAPVLLDKLNQMIQ